VEVDMPSLVTKYLPVKKVKTKVTKHTKKKRVKMMSGNRKTYGG
jgi:hypothetical protein